MKSRLALMAAVAVLSVSLSACGGTSTSDSGNGSGTIEVQTGVALDTKLMKTLTSITDAFQKANPGVKVNLVPSGTTYEQDMKVRLASGNVPDIWRTHGWSLLRYSKFLMPLQNEPWAKNFNPALSAAMKDSNGAFYAMPVDTDIAGILYNKDVLSKAGYKAEDIKTWDDFLKAAQAIKANGVSPIYVSEKANGPAGNVANWIAPGAFSKDDLAKMSSGTFVTDKYRSVVDLVAKWTAAGLFNPDYASATSDDMAKAMAQGTAGFEFTQNAVATNALQYNPNAPVGFLPVPSMSGGPNYLIGGETNAYGISKTTKNAQAAKAFISYLAQPENETKMAQAVGSAPGLTDAKTDLGALQPSYDSFVTQAKAPLVPYFDRVYLPNGMWNTMVTTTDSVITKQSDAAGAVSQMESSFKSLYGQGK